MSAPKEKQNIVVIGGGIIRCTAVYFLTHHPQFDLSIHTVTVIEAEKLANGASGKAGNLARLSFDLHDQLARDYNSAERWGYRRFDTESAQAYEEFANTSFIAQVHPFQFTSSMAKLVEQRGARIIIGTVEKKVVSVAYVDKIILEQYTLLAITVVLAAGPWTPSLFPKREYQAPKASVRLLLVFSEIRLGDSRQTVRAAKSISLEIYARPNNEVYISSGNAVEVSSNSCHDMINAAMSVSDELRNGKVIGRRACYLPTLDVGASSDPLVGPTELAGLVLATGHSCWGISNAPTTGKAVSELIPSRSKRQVFTVHAEVE
ncbi:FAD dependent oxidoreductase-domain-containing protein [Leptodontidium sp. 2 PMI_412]|nr:FAD dependent oxidoreductase-domain-containing protein [Leptodontidium sp. 2 PMI_412]